MFEARGSAVPKINVYLPDELADAVKAAGLPISAICQRALEQSVKRVTAIRAVTVGGLNAHDPIARLSRFTDRARTAMRLGLDSARATDAPEVGTGHLLHGLLEEGSNLAVHVLGAAELDLDRLRRQVAQRPAGPIGPPADATRPPVEPPGPSADRFSGAAANALELAVTEAVALGHDYVGCEHLLLGLLAEPEGTGGRALREAGAELRAVRGAVTAALAGYGYLRAQVTEPPPAALHEELTRLRARLSRLETHLGLDP